MPPQERQKLQPRSHTALNNVLQRYLKDRNMEGIRGIHNAITTGDRPKNTPGIGHLYPNYEKPWDNPGPGSWWNASFPSGGKLKPTWGGGNNSGIMAAASYGNNSGAELPPQYLSGGNNSGIGSLAAIPEALIEAVLTPPDGEGGWFNNNPWALNFLANKFGDSGSQQYLEDRGDSGIPFLGGKWKPKFKRGEEGGLNVGVEGKWSW